MGIGSGSLDGSANNAGRTLGIEWEMGMLVWEWQGMRTWNPFPLTSSMLMFPIASDCILMSGATLSTSPVTHVSSALSSL